MREPLAFIYKDNRLIVKNKADSDYSDSTPQSAWVGVHGAGVYRKRFVTTIKDLLTIPLPQDYSSEGVHLSGSLALYVRDSSGSYAILPDPIGAGLIFHYKKLGIEAISSDLGLLVDSLAEEGVVLAKSLAYLGILTATGSGGFGYAPYEGVEVLAPGLWVQAGKDGISFIPYTESSQIYTGSESYESALEAIAAEIQDQVQAAANYEADYKISHLTGGIDSRLVLAALRSLDLADVFSYYSMGGKGVPDYDIAYGICGSLPAKMTAFGGYVEVSRARSWKETFIGSYEETSGVANTLGSVWSQKNSSLILSGGYGEFFKSFYNKGEEAHSDPAVIAEQMFGQLGMGRNSRMCLLSEDFKNHLVTVLGKEIDEGLARGIRKDAVLDYRYMTGRNRFFVGEISRTLSHSVPRYDPLYSLQSARLALSLDGKTRNANVIGLDLMKKLDPVLASLPYDKDRLSGFYEELRGPQTRTNFSGLEPVVLPRPQLDLPKAPARTWSFPRVTPEETAYARKLGMQPRYMVQHQLIKAEMPEIIEEIGASKLGEIINMPLLQRYLAGQPHHRAIYRSLVNLYGSLAWYLNEEPLDV